MEQSFLVKTERQQLRFGKRGEGLELRSDSEGVCRGLMSHKFMPCIIATKYHQRTQKLASIVQREMVENTEDSLTTLRKASCASHGMKDGRMIQMRGNIETKVEMDWENTITVVIRVEDVRGHGATRRLKGLYGSTVTL